jgi:8-oxo-dGTP pyrophosphatase MutT (NUDIX family)/GNAT superfamily N-acetyltransferase
MGLQVVRLTDDHADDLHRLWLRADSARRAQRGRDAVTEAAPVLARPGAFGVGVFDGGCLVSAAVAMPARADDGRSDVNVPGLAHISSVVTAPERWGEGLAAISLRAVSSQARRHGFARCQLWTWADDERANRLYDRAGFVMSGRRRDHQVAAPTGTESAEAMVHYIRELDAPPHVLRPAARLLCLDAAGRVLLMHWRDPVDGHQLWEPPGGGIEPGESAREAVLREWQEETGLDAPHLVGDPTTVARDVFWAGGRIIAEETFFLARLQSGAAAPAAGPTLLRPTGLTSGEQVSYLGHTWADRSALAARVVDADPLEPDLAPVLDRLSPD